MKRLFVILLFYYANVASASLGDQDSWQFEVLLDEKKIGYHDFIVTEKDGNQTISIEAKFNVKL